MWKQTITGTNNIPLGKRRIGGTMEENESRDSRENEFYESHESYDLKELMEAGLLDQASEKSSGVHSLKRSNEEEADQHAGIT